MQTLWNMLGMAQRWKKFWPQWMDFLLNKKKRAHLTRDEWCVILVFSHDYPDSLDGYDPDGAWSALIDDFVSFIKGEDVE